MKLEHEKQLSVVNTLNTSVPLSNKILCYLIIHSNCRS